MCSQNLHCPLPQKGETQNFSFPTVCLSPPQSGSLFYLLRVADVLPLIKTSHHRKDSELESMHAEDVFLPEFPFDTDRTEVWEVDTLHYSPNSIL